MTAIAMGLLRSARAAAVLAAMTVCVTAPVRAQAPAAASTTTVIIVRHAERAAEPAADPVLTPAGETRAQALAEVLAHANLAGIVTSQFQRTRLTAAPVARARGLTPVIVPTGGGTAAHVRAVADSVRARFAGGTTLVVGHSNTVTRIATALGGPPLPDLCDGDYSSIFLLVLRDGAEPSLTRARYGPPDPPAPAAPPTGQAACR